MPACANLHICPVMYCHASSADMRASFEWLLQQTGSLRLESHAFQWGGGEGWQSVDSPALAAAAKAPAAVAAGAGFEGSAV
jgi:hypothetical protein